VRLLPGAPERQQDGHEKHHSDSGNGGEGTTDPQEVAEGQWPEASTRKFIGLGPLLAVGLMCMFLLDPQRALDRQQSMRVALLIFAGILAGTGQIWAVFPVSFLLGLLVFRRFVLIEERRYSILGQHAGEIRSHRSVSAG
jgi:hypothetical protein